ncbi:hypothetical protein [Ralstonia solanacearum]|uniref:hypothetical protein n=1 Tax=Ralstonia solanacearum TaxID=305 RepID=UPI0018D06FBB|nr:hypothetical protein [Ralstonia solanacearum]
MELRILLLGKSKTPASQTRHAGIPKARGKKGSTANIASPTPRRYRNPPQVATERTPMARAARSPPGCTAAWRICPADAIHTMTGHRFAA